MPVFEYFCKKCKKVHELWMSKYTPEALCPVCNSKMQKIMSKVGRPIIR
jgi:putative FmdB family regulatory protein